MTTTAGKTTTVHVSSDDSTYYEIDGIDTGSLKAAYDLLDDTDFKDTSNAHTRIAGLSDGSISLSGNYETEANGQGTLRTNAASGAATYIKFLWNGSAGHKVKCLVSDYTIDASAPGKVTFSCNLTFNGAVSAV